MNAMRPSRPILKNSLGTDKQSVTRIHKEYNDSSKIWQPVRYGGTTEQRQPVAWTARRFLRPQRQVQLQDDKSCRFPTQTLSKASFRFSSRRKSRSETETESETGNPPPNLVEWLPHSQPGNFGWRMGKADGRGESQTGDRHLQTSGFLRNLVQQNEG